MKKRRDPNRRAWSVTLAGGFVVLLAVWGLLETLRRTVADVESAVDRVWTVGKQVAQQTQAGHLLADTRMRTKAVNDGVGRKQ